MVFDLAICPPSCTRWQLGDGGGETRHSDVPKTKTLFLIRFSVYRCRGTWPKNMEKHGQKPIFLDVDQPKKMVICSVFFALDWSTQRYLHGFVCTCVFLRICVG